jgi:hypothetical protein
MWITRRPGADHADIAFASQFAERCNARRANKSGERELRTAPCVAMDMNRDECRDIYRGHGFVARLSGEDWRADLDFPVSDGSDDPDTTTEFRMSDDKRDGRNVFAATSWSPFSVALAAPASARRRRHRIGRLGERLLRFVPPPAQQQQKQPPAAAAAPAAEAWQLLQWAVRTGDYSLLLPPSSHLRPAVAATEATPTTVWSAPSSSRHGRIR